ncbi:hypothetical protein PRZ48_004026 [Zasmidium cellare]|uniref:LYR motif-containing protein Cup1-like N-terminal domain-containing protein n=1 Tax=Zasmidium cellare TaxID=395010 RepID=A0ABR0EY91_ZASCE|nr:hypothetical protein PRZ48_004026 [Zasmidium cellare]
MSCSCLRRPQTLSGPTGLRLLDVAARFYGTEPTAAQPPAHSRGQAINKTNKTSTTSKTSTTNKTNKPNKADKRDAKRATDARHWLRAILRECTYLPDPKAGRFVSQYVLDRFRTYQHKTWRNRNVERIVGFESRIKAKEKELRLFYNMLSRANEGETKPLLKVLNMAYGRVGKRRHDLMEPLLAKPAKEDTGPVVEFNQDGKAVIREDTPGDVVVSSTDEDKYRLSPALYALLQSQKLVGPPDRTRPNPRKLRPEIPELNSKMRPMPASRVKNLTKKWYSDTLGRVLPPLPPDEWHQLQKLAQGEGISKQPRRRKSLEKAGSIAEQKGTALDMIIKGNIDRKEFPNANAHTITTRYMQRLYALIFQQCPLMDFDSEKGKWSITWGKYALGSASSKVNKNPA